MKTDERAEPRGVPYISIPKAPDMTDTVNAGPTTSFPRPCAPPADRRLLLLIRHEEIGPPIVDHLTESIQCATKKTLSKLTRYAQR